MSIVRGFTNQRVVFTQYEGTDGFGEDTYADPVTIKARKERQQKYVSAEGGVQIMSTTYVLTERLINTGDRIDGERVVAVEDIVDKGGKFLGTECYL